MYTRATRRIHTACSAGLRTSNEIQRMVPRMPQATDRCALYNCTYAAVTLCVKKVELMGSSKRAGKIREMERMVMFLEDDT